MLKSILKKKAVAVDGLKALMRLAAMTADKWQTIDEEVHQERINKKNASKRLKKGVSSKQKSEFRIRRQTTTTAVVPISIAAVVCCCHLFDNTTDSAQLLGPATGNDDDLEDQPDKVLRRKARIAKTKSHSGKPHHPSNGESMKRRLKKPSSRLVPRCFKDSILPKVSDAPEPDPSTKVKSVVCRFNQLTCPNYKRRLINMSKSEDLSRGQEHIDDISELLYSAAQTFVPEGMEYRDVTAVRKPRVPEKPASPPRRPRPRTGPRDIQNSAAHHERRESVTPSVCESRNSSLPLAPCNRMSFISCEVETCYINEVQNLPTWSFVGSDSIKETEESTGRVSDSFRPSATEGVVSTRCLEEEQVINSGVSNLERNREIVELMSTLNDDVPLDFTSVVEFKPNYSLEVQIQNAISHELAGKVLRPHNPNPHQFVYRKKKTSQLT